MKYTKRGRWLFVPLSEIETPKSGLVCHAPAWWLITENKEVLFFDTLGSPQCNANKPIAERLGKGFEAPPTTVKFLKYTFLPAIK